MHVLEIADICSARAEGELAKVLAALAQRRHHRLRVRAAAAVCGEERAGFLQERINLLCQETSKTRDGEVQ